MELPTRPPADRFTRPGRYRELENQIRCRVERDNIPILLVYAFDPRTRLGPFVFVDKTLIPGAPRAVQLEDARILSDGRSKHGKQNEFIEPRRGRLGPRQRRGCTVR